MRIVNILTQTRRQPPQLLIGIISFLMVLGFCLQNAKLIPSLPGEYQPLIFLAGCCLAILVWPIPKPARIATIALAGGLVLSILFHTIFAGPRLPSLSDLLRLAVGPVMMAGTAAAWRRIDYRWLWSIFVAALLFAAAGIINPNLTTNFVSALGIRINDGGTAYAPWAAFFFAEYSYAALAFAAAYAWLNSRTELSNHQRWLLVGITVLLIGLTRSGTGFALIGIILLSQLRPRYWIIALVILGVAFFLSPRVETLVNGLVQLAHGDVEQVITVDPGSSWRFLSNYLALKVESIAPLGTMGLDMNNYHHLLPLYSQHTQELINSFLLGTNPTPAQGPFFNYGLFGGIILQISLCFAFAMALINTGSFRRNQSILLGLLVLYSFFVQSGLTSPVPWILLGIWLSPPEKC